MIDGLVQALHPQDAYLEIEENVWLFRIGTRRSVDRLTRLALDQRMLIGRIERDASGFELVIAKDKFALESFRRRWGRL